MYRYIRLAATAVAGGAAPLGLYLGEVPSWVLIGLLALVFVLGWPELAALPQPLSARLVLTAAAALSVGLAAFWSSSSMAATAVLVALGVGFPLAVVRELARPLPRPGLIRSLTGTSAGLVLVTLAGTYFGVEGGPDQPWVLALVGTAGLAAACLVLMVGLPFDRRFSWVPLASLFLALAAGFGAGWGTTLLVGEVTWWLGGAVGASCALAPGFLTLWLASWPARTWAVRPSLRDAALITLPGVVAALPVWAAGLIH